MSSATPSILSSRWFRLLLGVAVLGLVVGIGYLGLVVAVWSSIAPGPKIPFSAEQWREAGTTSTDDARYRMHEDLLRRHRLVGMSRDDVVALLVQRG